MQYCSGKWIPLGPEMCNRSDYLIVIVFKIGWGNRNRNCFLIETYLFVNYMVTNKGDKIKARKHNLIFYDIINHPVCPFSGAD